jgi:hypothetical protein
MVFILIKIYKTKKQKKVYFWQNEKKWYSSSMEYDKQHFFAKQWRSHPSFHSNEFLIQRSEQRNKVLCFQMKLKFESFCFFFNSEKIFKFWQNSIFVIILSLSLTVNLILSGTKTTTKMSLFSTETIFIFWVINSFWKQITLVARQRL